MKRALKITVITLASLVGVVSIAVAIVCHIVFTPDRLTPIVRQVADKFIRCEHEVGEVDLTFFSTFPEFGLKVDGLYLVNPMAGAPSDTLLAAPKVVATVNVVEFLAHRNLVIRELGLPGAVANIYINAEGEGNYDVFVTSPDSTEEDTTAFALPFDAIRLDALEISAREISFVSAKDSISAKLAETSLKADARSWDDVQVRLRSGHVAAQVGDVQYADDLRVALDVPAAVDLTNMLFALKKAEVSVNEFALGIDGEINLKDTVILNVDIVADDWQIRPLLSLLPSNIARMISDIRADGEVSLQAHVEGGFGDGQMPLVDAELELNDGAATYKPLPYELRDILLRATAHIDLNDDKASQVDIQKLRAKTMSSKVEASGRISELLADMLLDLNLNLGVNLPDVAYFLPENMKVKGSVDGKAGVRIRLSDLTNMQLQKGAIQGDLRLRDIDFQMDSILATIPSTSTLSFRIPNVKPSHKTLSWLDAALAIEGLQAEMIGTLRANTGATQLHVEAGDLLSNNPILYAAVDLQSNEVIRVEMDSMDAAIRAPKLQAYVEYDSKTEKAVPYLDTEMNFDDLKVTYTDIKAHLTESSLMARLTSTRLSKSAPQLSAEVSSNSIQASMGTDIVANTKRCSVAATAKYNSAGQNLLLKWNPTLNFDLNDAHVTMSAIDKPIDIPQITFAYSNQNFNISQSKVILGNSDFSLTGQVHNMARWMQKRGTLTGELNFTSSHTDVNELLDLCSADHGSEEEPAAEAATESAPSTPADGDEPKPFMVPTAVDLTLNTDIREAIVFNEVAHNLGGRIYVKDGMLVLEEVGFVCNAAKLQLTAMYRTPRRNHIYLGLDYHMLDIDIKELISMIPQLDTMVPMLSSFRGAAEFHLAAETYLNAKYELKPSTIRGACSIFGKDLVVMDSETFSTISKLLMFNKKTENKVDSISAEITLFEKEIDVYPFCVSIDNYMAALGGRHNLDMSFDYHISLLSPFYLGVDVRGTFDDLSIKLAKCKFAQDFKPLFHRKVDTQSAELRSMIRESMRKNVKIE